MRLPDCRRLPRFTQDEHDYTRESRRIPRIIQELGFGHSRAGRALSPRHDETLPFGHSQDSRTLLMTDVAALGGLQARTTTMDASKGH